MKRSRKTSDCCAADEVQQKLAFNAFLLPIYSREWLRELTSPKPRWMYLALLHRHMLEMEETF